MTISDFTKIRLVIGALLLSLSASTWSQEINETTKFANSQTQLQTVCSNKDGGTNCYVFSVTDGKKKKLISFPFAPSDIKFESGVFVLVFPCGTECSATYFYSLSKGMGGPFPLVAGYDLKQGVALSLSKNPLPIFNIYARRGEKPVSTIKLDATNAQDLPSLVKNAEFKDGTVTVTYTDSTGKEKVATQVLNK